MSVIKHTNSLFIIRNFFKLFISLIDKNKKEVALYFYPTLLLVIFGFFLIPAPTIYLFEILNFCLVTIILLLLIIVFNNARLRCFLYWLFFFFLTSSNIIKLSFYHHYKERLSASALFVAFETYTEEAFSFFTTFLDGFTILIVLAHLLVFLGIFFNIKKQKTTIKKTVIKTSTIGKLLIIGFICCFGFLIKKKLFRENTLLISYNAHRDYQKYKETLSSNLGKPTTDILTNVSPVKTAQTHVIIIGESTSSQNMQLYNYKRATNPLLKEIEEDLLVFKNTVAPEVHTILSLNKVLTLETKIKETNRNASIIQLANMAGYKTYWLSNQRKIGLYESSISIIGEACDYSYFLNTEDYDYPVYDENLIPKFNSILQDENEKRIIFIHLMGTHSTYKSRYPESFNFFKGTNYPSPFKHSKAKRFINTYDNAVRYNDYVIRQFIENLKKQSLTSSLIYFSDHGDDVYTTSDTFLGHNKFNATAPMYDVPLIFWTSKNNTLQKQAFKLNENTSYNLKDFFHTFSDMTSIKFDSYDASKSLLHSN